MAEEEMQTVSLQVEFYRDGYKKLFMLLLAFSVAILLMFALSLYLHFSKPKPVFFITDKEWRVLPEVAVTEPYLAVPDLLQWVSNVIPEVFSYNFDQYADQLQSHKAFFTDNGWTIYQNQLNIYANYNNVQAGKQFIKATLTGAPYVLNQGLLSGKYAWWVQVPIDINYIGINENYLRNLSLQILVVRVSTLNNLTGVAIENVIVDKNTGSSPQVGNG